MLDSFRPTRCPITSHHFQRLRRCRQYHRKTVISNCVLDTWNRPLLYRSKKKEICNGLGHETLARDNIDGSRDNNRNSRATTEVYSRSSRSSFRLTVIHPRVTTPDPTSELFSEDPEVTGPGFSTSILAPGPNTETSGGSVCESWCPATVRPQVRRDGSSGSSKSRRERKSGNFVVEWEDYVYNRFH